MGMLRTSSPHDGIGLHDSHLMQEKLCGLLADPRYQAIVTTGMKDAHRTRCPLYRRDRALTACYAFPGRVDAT